jgi:hypothetical protein
MTDKESHDPQPAPTNHQLAELKDKAVWVKGGVGVALFTAIVTAVFQFGQWFYQDLSRKKEQDIANILDVQKSLNEFVYPRFWRSKRVIEAMEESRQNTDVLGILAEFDGLEAKWLDNEAYLRARLQFYVDSPAGRQAQFKRDSISRENPECVNPDAFDRTGVNRDNASDVLQLLSHCQFLAGVSIKKLRKLDECRQLTALGEQKKDFEQKLAKFRLDQAWYLQDILQCAVAKQAETSRGTLLSSLEHRVSELAGWARTDCDQAYRKYIEEVKRSARNDRFAAKINEWDALSPTPKYCKQAGTR